LISLGDKSIQFLTLTLDVLLCFVEPRTHIYRLKV